MAVEDAAPPLPLDAPVAVVCGHYGVGKTNLTLNIALDAAAAGRAVTVIDLDVVNPFFRSSDYRALLDERGIRLVAPVFAGTNVDGPSLSGTIEPAIDGAQRAWRDGDERPFVVIDAGGDDVGATALGRFAPRIAERDHAVWYVVNRYRNLTQEPAEAVEVLREIEAKSHLRATCVVNNTHLQHDTDAQVVEQGLPFAQAVAQAAGLPLACTTVPAAAARQVADRETTHRAPNGDRQTYYPVQVYVRTPWE